MTIEQQNEELKILLEMAICTLMDAGVHYQELDAKYKQVTQ